MYCMSLSIYYFFFFQAEDGIRDYKVTGVQTCALPISDFYEGLAQIRVTAGGEEWYGFLNRNGQVVIEPKFENAWHFSEGLAQIAQGKKWGFVDKQGTMIIGPQFDAVRYFADGLAAFEVNGKWGFIDKSGRVIINPRFDRAWNYSEGAALIAVDDRVGYVDKAGNYTWPPSK